MIEVILTDGAKNDLVGIRNYISDDLGNVSAALQTVSSITKRMHVLEDFPEMGTLLKAEENILGYRYLICGNYMVFYHLTEKNVLIDRVLYGRRNYLSLLFDREIQLDNTEDKG